MLFRYRYRCGLFCLSSKGDICKAIRASRATSWSMEEDHIRTPFHLSNLSNLSNPAYPLFIKDFDVTFPCKALGGRWIRVGEPTSAKKAFKASGRVFQLRLPTQTENPPAGWGRTSVVTSVFFWRFRAALLAACERMGSSPAGLERAECACSSSSSSSSNSVLVRFGMGLEGEYNVRPSTIPQGSEAQH